MQKTTFCNRNVVFFWRLAKTRGRLFPQMSSKMAKLFAQTLLIMRLIIILLILGLFKANAKAFSQTVTFSGKDVKLTKIFKVIERQTGYTVFANKELLKGTKPVNVEVTNVPIANFLALIFKNEPVGYEINKTTIFIKENTVPRTKIPLPAVSETADTSVHITGVVTDTGKVPLSGATVFIKGARIATQTDVSGRFSIDIKKGEALIISFIGYETKEVSTVGGRTNINIELVPVEREAEQVVVTALGISKKARSLSYNVQEVGGDEVNKVTDANANFVNSLAGKVAGVAINTSSSGVGGSTRIVMRGEKSLSGNNNALYVIDGIPMPNNIPIRMSDNTPTQAENIFQGAGQTGDFISHLNPEDIESISILSGPSAAALYGSAAANGVVMVTTKKGKQDKLDVSASNSTSFSSPLILPKFQNTYGVSETGSYYSWGDKLQTPSDYNPADFFQTGVNSSTGISVSTGNEKSQTYISFGNVTANGIVPNNKYSRYNFTARNTTSMLNGKLDMDMGFMAGLINEQNMVSQGQYFNPLVAVYLFPPGDDFNRVKAFERYDPSRNLKTQFWPYGDNGLMLQNPYWVTQRDLFPNAKERYMATLSLKYNIASWINVTVRGKLDKDNEKDEKKFAASTNTLFASKNGYYSLNTMNTRQLYGEGLVSINKTFNNDYSLVANIGTSIEDVLFDQYLYGGKLQGVANLYSFTNIDRTNTDISQAGYHKQKQAVFASVQAGYKDMVYLDMSARNDWASTLAASDNGKSFFYPSIGLSGVLTDMLHIKSNLLSYLKVRASYSQVGNEPDPFLTIPTYSLTGGYPVTQTRMPNPNLKPELTKSWEAGFNSAFLNGALKIDATVYSSRTYNQFFEPTLSSSSGYTSVIVNAGRVDNKGIEVNARYSARFGNFKWSTYANYSLNKNKIVQLLPGWKNPVTGEIVSLHELDESGTGSYKMELKEGGSMGDIYVNTLRTDEHGLIYINTTSAEVVGEANTFVYAGNSNPLYNIGWGNDLKWKGISLSFLFSARVGGIVVSNTQAIMDAFGVSKASADARDAGGALVNGQRIPAQPYYQVVGGGASGGIASMYVYSATNVRLGELAIGYDLPVKKWNKVVKSANISLIGHNLFFLYNTAPFDPELTSNTQTYFQGIDYFMMPGLRSLGFSVKLNF